MPTTTRPASSPGSICFVRGDDGDGAGSVGDDLLGDRPEDELGDPVESGAADDDEGGVLGRLEQSGRGGARVEGSVDGRRLVRVAWRRVTASSRTACAASRMRSSERPTGAGPRPTGGKRDRPAVDHVERHVTAGGDIQSPGGSGERLF